MGTRFFYLICILPLLLKNLMKTYFILISLFVINFSFGQIIITGDENIRSRVSAIATSSYCYWITIYSGGSSSEANAEREKFLRLYPDKTDVQMESKPPNYVVKIGKFGSEQKAKAFADKMRGQFKICTIPDPEKDCWTRSFND
jgi:hypothetical protein